ncbi:MAG: LysM peptidoglycan-binding domain-containing protein [Anaerolineales bacterium]|nr:LysM peptidoglycan-binding domain-containing protein [Anaerolineales bacterium]
MSQTKILVSLISAAVLLVSLTRPAMAASCPAGMVEYTVKRGDWIYRIARAFGTTPEKITADNKLANPNAIFVGQKLCVATQAGAGATGTPAPPTPTPPAYVCCPSFRIVAVERNKTVTIETTNFPAGLRFDVRMAARGNRAIGGLLVGTQDSGAGGRFRATFNIPAALAGLNQIAIRLEHTGTGYHAYNWFYNNTVTLP